MPGSYDDGGALDRSLDHPNYVFGFGSAGDQVRTEADVMLIVGSRVGTSMCPTTSTGVTPPGSA